MTLVPERSPEPTRSVSTLVLSYLPELETSPMWSYLTTSERDSWHLALGTATGWLVEQVGNRASGTHLSTRYAALLEEIAGSGDVEGHNAVVISALEILDPHLPGVEQLRSQLGPRTLQLADEWSVF